MAAIQHPDYSSQHRLAQLRHLVDRAKEGDLEALAPLRRFLAAQPEAFWQAAGAPAAGVESLQIDLLAGDDPRSRQLLLEQIAAMRQELAGAQPAPMVRLLVDRVIACWLSVTHAQLMHDLAADPSEYLERRLTRAQRRFCFALRQLAMVQRTM